MRRGARTAALALMAAWPLLACSDSSGEEQAVDAAPEVAAPDVPVAETDEGAPEVDVPAADDGAGEADAPPSGYAYLVVEPTSLDLGVHPPGAVVTGDLELENAGTAPLTLSEVGFVEGGAAWATNATPSVLAAGERRDAKVTFYALEAGQWDDVLRLRSDAINAEVLEIPVTGAVVEVACQDPDGDLHGAGCAAGADCNESDPDVYVGAPERCNGRDDDCDGLHDEDYVGLGDACEVGFGACVAEGARICADDEVTLACSVNPVTGGSELCNGLDDDCDGGTDEDFPSKGAPCSVGKGACRAWDKYVCNGDGTALVCNVTPGTPGVEVCANGVDDDCDGVVDEGELEVCGNGVDEDCDGETDESGSPWGAVFFGRNQDGTVAVYPSNGDGTFEAPETLDFPGEDRFGVHAVGDFDGDRWLDLVVVRTEVAGETTCGGDVTCPAGQRCAGGVCRVLCGTGASCPSGQTCVDHDSDGVADDTWCAPPRPVQLAVVGCGGDAIELTTLFMLEPDERLGPVIDADGNGHLDFVVLDHWTTPTGHLWMSDGDGGFAKKTGAFGYGSLIAWQYGIAYTSKDLDGDGLVDLLGWRFDSGGAPPTRLYLLRGHGDGTFDDPAELSVQVPEPANLITADDFDGDGDHDIVAGLDDDGQPGNVWMLLNRGADDADAWNPAYGVFDLVPKYNSGGEHPGVGDGTSFDFDGDDLPDVLAAWIPEECGSYVWGCSGVSDPSHVCYGGRCRKVAYIRNRTGSACVAGTSCLDGTCQPGCEAGCSGKQCGPDGCGGTCGDCDGGQICAGGQCVVDCQPQCDGKVCGPDGCGGTCGDCVGGEACLQGQCQPGCVPSCDGKQCGDDGCGGACAVFDTPQVLEFSDNASTALRAPTNVPPTVPVVAIEPAAPGADDDLACAVVEESFDMDEVTYRRRWLRDGVYVKALGDAEVAPADLTAPGEVWTCRVRATDGIEWSPVVEAQATVGQGGEP